MTSKPQVKIIDAETGEEIIRDANAEEIAQMAKDNAEFEAKLQAEQEKVIAKEAVIAKLGLTAEEVAALLA